MMKYISQFVNSRNKTGVGLVFWAVLLVFSLIILQNAGVLPMRTSDFAFFSLVALALALYRPGWAFLFFVSLIALENVNLASGKIGIAVRPYQLLGAFVLIAILMRLVSKKLPFKLIRPLLWDWLLLAMTVSGFVSALFSSERGASLKLSVIVLSFFALYLLVRNYVQDKDDLGKTVPFFLSSAAVVSLYGIWQNVRSVLGLSSFEVMPGRPNAAFSEPDWLGMFLVFVLAVIYAVMYFYAVYDREEGRNDIEFKSTRLFSYLFLVLIFTLLIITVSRSAWLGAFAVTFVFLSVSFVRVIRKEWKFWGFARMKIGIVSTAVLALALVFIFHLTNFQLFNRAQSTGSGLQKITIACDSESDLEFFKDPIGDTTELSGHNCEHINLEDIDSEKAKGKVVGEVMRKDPNVNIRAEIYEKSWQEIKKHPLLGIGWGSIGRALGTDERGAALNSSNIFLEIWLGSGIIGLLAFVSLLGFIMFGAIKLFFQGKDNETAAIGIFLISSWFAIVVPNLFNAGILMAYLWVWMGVSISLIANHSNE